MLLASIRELVYIPCQEYCGFNFGLLVQEIQLLEMVKPLLNLAPVFTGCSHPRHLIGHNAVVSSFLHSEIVSQGVFIVTDESSR